MGGGALLELPMGSDLDYMLGSDKHIIEIDKLPIINSTDNGYNQLEFKEFGTNMCTLYAGICMHSNNRMTPINEIDRKQMSKIRYSLPDFDPNVGGYIPVGIKVVIDYTLDGIFYRIHKSKIKQLLDKGYVVNYGLYVGSDTSRATTDGVFTSKEIEEIKNARSGHSTCLRKNIRINSYEGVIDNNKVVIQDIDKFIAGWFVYDWAYITIDTKIIREYFKKNILTSVYKTDVDYGVELMKDKKIYPREFEVYQKLISDKYIKRKSV